MTSEVHQQLESYLALRRALGFTMRPEERLLRDFVTHLDRRSDATSVAQVAIEWSMATAGVSHARRLSIVRGFLTMARATDPSIDVPGTGLLRTSRRPTPHLFTPDEILALMNAARALGPRDTLRPSTVATVIGLLASCGLRASEAIGLDVTDVTLEDVSRRLRQTKFHKSRLVPLHPTTADALRAYADRRQTLGYDGLCDAFFVSERGTRLSYHTLARTFVTLARQLRLRGPVGTRGASLHHLRHSFAVDRLAAWTREGCDVQLQLPALAVYLGHVRPQNTYWYLTVAPQVLEPAAARFEKYAERSVGS
jgi:integrase/recombinase XerD